MGSIASQCVNLESFAGQSVVRLSSILVLVAGICWSGVLYPLAIEVQSVSLPATDGSTGFIAVPFVSPVFSDNGVTPLVFVVPTTEGDDPCSVRIENVSATGFDAACVEPPGEDGPHETMTLNYIAIEPGVHTIPTASGGTVVISVGSVDTTAVQHKCGGCGTRGFETVSFGNTYGSSPAVLLQIQTTNSEDPGTPPPGGPSEPFLTATIPGNGSGITTTTAQIALERSEVPEGTVVAETLAWLAVESTGGCEVLDFSSFGGPSAVPFEAIITGNVADGWSNGCTNGEGASWDGGCFSSPPVIGVSKRTRNGIDGGWLRSCTNTSSGLTLTLDEDRSTDNDRAHVREAASILAFGPEFFTPVTLTSFSAMPEPDGVRFSWQTAGEFGTVGFWLSEKVADGWRSLHDELITSDPADGLSLREYTTKFSGVEGVEFRLTEVDRRLRQRDLGPFRLGEPAGREVELRRQPRPPERVHSKRRELTPADGIELLVDETGIYRVSYETLRDQGLDLDGVVAADLALTSGGEPQSLRVYSPNGRTTFGLGSFIEFFGEAVEGSLYTRQRVYRLLVDSSSALRIRERSDQVPDEEAPTDYLEHLLVDKNLSYNFSAPGSDPWFEKAILAYDAAVTSTFDLVLDELVPGDRTARVWLRLWGGTDFPNQIDHHVQVRLNGELIAEETFDGLSQLVLEAEVSSAALRDGSNELEITVVGDTGVDFSLVQVDSYSVGYPRRFVARPSEDRLEFTARSAVFEIEGLPEGDPLIYQVVSGTPPVLQTAYETTSDGAIAFRGDNARVARYFVLAPAAALSPAKFRAPAGTDGDLLSGLGEYLAIAPREFFDGVQPLLDARETGGLHTKLVDVEAVYAAYSGGVVDPEAIRSYLADATSELGTRFVLLVGGDTYDYFDYTGSGSRSFVPTLYAQIDPVVRYAPADPLLADIDRDGFPDLPIGRLPVRNAEELAGVVAKTLAYDSGIDPSMILAADGDEGMTSFRYAADRLLESVPSNWRIERAYLDELTVEEARQTVVDEIERGVSLTAFIGHSGPADWTFDGLFSAADAAALTNTEPTVVVQWGCWNAYFVEPTFETLAHALLLSGSNGAAAVLGSTSLSTLSSEAQLASKLLEQAMTPGLTLGEALQNAKEQLQMSSPEALDALVGWTLLGDPALQLVPEL